MAKVTVFTDSQYRGVGRILRIGFHDWGQIPNDRISSMQIDAGLRVTVYEHTRGEGKHHTFFRDVPYVGDEFNDAISSILVEMHEPPDTPLP